MYCCGFTALAGEARGRATTLAQFVMLNIVIVVCPLIVLIVVYAYFIV